MLLVEEPSLVESPLMVQVEAQLTAVELTLRWMPKLVAWLADLTIHDTGLTAHVALQSDRLLTQHHVGSRVEY